MERIYDKFTSINLVMWYGLRSAAQLKVTKSDTESHLIFKLTSLIEFYTYKFVFFFYFLLYCSTNWSQSTRMWRCAVRRDQVNCIAHSMQHHRQRWRSSGHRVYRKRPCKTFTYAAHNFYSLHTERVQFIPFLTRHLYFFQLKWEIKITKQKKSNRCSVCLSQMICTHKHYMTTTYRDISHSWDGFHMQRNDISFTRAFLFFIFIIISDADCGCGKPMHAEPTLCVSYIWSMKREI